MVHVVYILVSQDNSGVILWILAQIEKRKAYHHNKTNGDIAAVKPFLKSLMSKAPPRVPGLHYPRSARVTPASWSRHKAQPVPSCSPSRGHVVPPRFTTHCSWDPPEDPP